jgi:hypothetical protein
MLRTWIYAGPARTPTSPSAELALAAAARAHPQTSPAPLDPEAASCHQRSASIGLPSST